MIYFSKKTCSFYPEDLLYRYEAAGTLPDDLVKVSESVFNEFKGDAPKGKTRGVGGNGLPVWIDIVVTVNELIKDANQKKSQLIDDATKEIAYLQDAVELEIATDEEKDKLLSWKRYRVLLSRLDVSDPNTVFPEHP